MNNISSPIQYFTKDHAVSMSLRDYLAAQAMQSYLSDKDLVDMYVFLQKNPKEEIAREAYVMADFMMKAREA
jgi:hypothetical protein